MREARLSADNVADAAERVQENVSNLPITSVALAGLMGAGVMALLSMFGRRSRST